MKYQNEEFVSEVNDKLGNVKFFRAKLREKDMLKNRELLSDKHIPIFISIRNEKETNNLTWDEAMDKVLDQYDSPTENDDNVLYAILNELKEIKLILKENTNK
ncbi:MAG TPA: hypothetical protein VEY70_10170 [Metabacillus sp.]|nr:hypothetical protein [Metabacillus sp.]